MKKISKVRIWEEAKLWLGNGITVAIALLLSGCATRAPDYEVPELAKQHGDAWSGDLSKQYADSSRDGMSDTVDWHLFRDPVLEGLIEELLQSNLTLAEARERMVESQAQRDVTAANRKPDVNLLAETYTAGTGEKGLAFQGPPPGQEMEIYSLGGLARWEIDFWGRTASLIEASDRESEAWQEAYRNAVVSMVAELSLAYIDARALEQRIGLLDEKFNLLEQSLELAQSRLSAGNGTQLEVIRISEQLERTRALKPARMQEYTLACNRIAVLTGKPPAEFSLSPGGFPEVPGTPDLGIPADLLTRRADIRQAERIYAASVFRARAAEAERYPRLSLTGSLKLQTNVTGNLLSSDALVYSLGPSLTYPLFNGGRIASQIDVRQSQSEQARLRLEQSLLQAVADVENAAVSVIQNSDRKQHLSNALVQSRQAVHLSEQLHQSGLGNLVQVVNAQQELVERKDEYLVANQAELNGYIRLYRSLGGGWETLKK